MKREFWSTPLTFRGTHSTTVTATALLSRRMLSTTYRVKDIAFCGGSVLSTDEQVKSGKRLTEYVRSFVGKTAAEWNAAALGSTIWPIGTVMHFRPAYVPPKKFKEGGFTGNGDTKIEEGAMGTSWGGGLKFVGDFGVQVNATAHICGSKIDDVLVTQVVPANGTATQQEEVERLREIARGFIGQYPGAWTGHGSVYDARRPDPNRRTTKRHGVLRDELAPANGPARTPSNTLGRVMREMRDREQFGLGKYGTTVDRTDLSVKQWLQHAKEEAMDSVLYLDRLIQEEEVREADPARPSTRPKWAQPCPMALYTGLHACHHNTAVNLTGIWTEAFGPPVTDVRTPLGFEPRKVAPPSSDFFDTRLSA